MNTPRRVYIEYKKWRPHWDELCNRCGQCCYTRHFSSTGDVLVDRSDPCKYLDEDTGLCSVYQNRFREYSGCGRVNLFCALFHPLLPHDCAYVQTFRNNTKSKTDAGKQKTHANNLHNV